MPLLPNQFEVKMLAFGDGKIRVVTVPDAALGAPFPDEEALLDMIFHYGQNDFQPQRIPSVSCGDVIRLRGKRYRVAPIGFDKLSSKEGT